MRQSRLIVTITAAVGAIASLVALTTALVAHSGPAPTGVYVNGKPVPAHALARFEGRFGVRLLPGRYWYDTRHAAWRATGGGFVGVSEPSGPQMH